MESLNRNSSDEIQYITEDDIKLILTKHGYANENTIIEKYIVYKASDKMIGFVADYIKIQISVNLNNNRKVLSYFVKAAPSNEAKANMAQELRAFEKEVTFYDDIKRKIAVPGLKPWSTHFVTCLRDAIVFEDLSALQYEMRSRHEKFDKQHTLQALQTLARFHASTILFEEAKTKEIQQTYTLYGQYKDFLRETGYSETDPWFIQCRTGALGAVKAFSKYRQNMDCMKIIENRWNSVFTSALSLSEASSKRRNVLCHRDLWNNNILFHYKRLNDNSVEPDNCVFVDFVAAGYMPPAGDVMQLLHCNLTPKFRKDNLYTFLNYYYDELNIILENNNVDILTIMTKDEFMTSAKEQNLWGLVTHACLVQVFWLDDDMTANLFGDSTQFGEIMTKDKTTYIKNMMQKDNGYKETVMGVFEEFIEDYLLNEIHIAS